MTISEAMKARHKVTKYTTKTIPADVTLQITLRLTEINEKAGLSMRLVTENDNGLSSFAKLFIGKNARNYIILAGTKADDLEEKLGYYGADMALFVQTLGLNSWWIGGTYNKKLPKESAGEEIYGILVIGYGETQGTPHKSKVAAEVSSFEGDAPKNSNNDEGTASESKEGNDDKTPAWFTSGIEAALLAPTALNKQAFMIRGTGNSVSISYAPSVYSKVDTGIVKYHFEQGAGVENFSWK